MYESKFRDVYGATLCFGGPHEVFTKGYKQAWFRVTTGMLQVLFAESPSAYMGGIRAVVRASIEEEEAADSLPTLRRLWKQRSLGLPAMQLRRKPLTASPVPRRL